MKKGPETVTLKDLSNKIDRVFGVLGNVDERLTGVEQRLRGIDHGLSQVKNTTEDIKETVDGLAGAVDKDAISILDHERRIRRLEKTRG